MSKREKIIVGVMIFSILFALAYYLSPAITKPGAKPADQYTGSEKIIQEIAAELKKVASSPTESYVIARAEAAWAKDPFYKKVQPAAAKAGPGGAGGPDIVYSGFVDMGEKKLAVINGNTYQVGEKLDFGSAFYLRSVDASQVVINDRQNQRNIVIKLKDETF
ncbi:MAG: hypothetical protein HPY67_04950 [Syntrophaceae bacterium]|nr:hypothetical protein [Syntrophaceae bacterium]